MTPTEFLAQLLPDGLVVIAEPAGRGFKQTVCSSIAEAAQVATRIDQSGKDCYFGLGSLKAPHVWNPNWKNEHGKVVGKKEVRTGANISHLRSFFVDIDIHPTDPHKYADQATALAALDTLCCDTAFPSPVVVSSGGGLHCYWPFAKPIAAEAWRPLATTFKAALQAQGLKFDPSRTADASSVLRVVGTHNYKQPAKRRVEVLRKAESNSTKDLYQYVLQLATVAHVAPPAAPAVATPFDALGSNTQRQFDPSDFGPIIRGCLQLQHVLRDGGLTSGEPAWYAGLGVARLCSTPERAALFISDRYPNFDRKEMDRKLQHLDSQSTGPTTCKTFDSRAPGICAACKSWGKITSPIVLGRGTVVEEAAPPTVEVRDEETDELLEITIPNPPFPFVRREGGGIIARVKAQGATEETLDVVYEHDMYPLRRMVNERAESEETVWRVKLPLEGWIEVTVPQVNLANEAAVHGLLLKKGVYIRPAKLKQMVAFMVAYITQLQRESRTEQLFARLGWREDHAAFVLGDRVYRPGGQVDKHQMPPEMRQELPGLRRNGTLEGWKEAIQFYNVADHHAHRFMLYGAFGSPLLHMAGHHGVTINAYGPSGIGKTRTLHAINSVWGHPEELGTSGTAQGTTVNARFALLSVYNNLPFTFDEITLVAPKVFGEFVMTVPQGKGRRRLLRSGALSKNVETWDTAVYTSANTDAYMSLMQHRRDATAEAMRLLQIPFSLPSVYTQAQADHAYQTGLMQHFGHAGHVFAPYIVDKYAKIQETVREVVARTSERGRMPIAERFQSGIIGAHVVGALIARKLGLLADFPVESDWAWMIDQLAGMRKAIQEHHATAREILSEFLESRVGETLVVSQTLGRNIAPRIDQVPRGALSIRIEADMALLFLLKAEFKRYCIETGANYGEIQETLLVENILIDANARRILGAGTDFSKGQVPCWIIDLKELQK